VTFAGWLATAAINRVCASSPVLVQSQCREPLVPDSRIDDRHHELLGTLLTALVIAREWERGTLEALYATPLTRGQILIGKDAALLSCWR